MKTPVLEVTGINKSFSGHKVLNNIDFTVNAGEIVCLMGENGCGKSTLIKIISGVYEADDGKIMLNGKHYAKPSPTDSIKEGIQVIYQDFSVFSNLTVAENISLGMQIVEGKKLVNWKQMRTQAAKALEAIGVDMDLDEDVSNLAVAQKQIVAISRAILQDAKLIIMDEPTTALTQKEINRLYEIIRGLSAKGIAVIFVSHKLDEVFVVCQRIAVIRNGIKVADEVKEQFDHDKLIYYMTGQEIKETPFDFKKISDEPVMEAENLSQNGAFKDVSFSLYPGEILGITGQLGSGRTELAKALFGIGRIDSGVLRVKGEAKKFNSIHDALECKIGYVPEDRLTEGLHLNRSVTDNINAVIIDSMKGRFGLLRKDKMDEEAVKRTGALKISIPSVDVLANTFSGGNQQRIVIGKWLANNPEILILNGPTMGVDVKSKSEIHRILKELAAGGLAVILISDDIGEVLSTTNRIMVMNQGTVTYSGITAETSEELLSAKITQPVGEEEAHG